MKKEITNLLVWYANRVAETALYTNWSDEFCRQEIKSATDGLLDEIRKQIDWDHLTREEALELGFRRWSDDQPDLYLLPLYLLPILPAGTKLICINGKEVIYDGYNVDMDTRGGLIAYGICIKE